jgi:phosphatidylserine decarboxylase
LRVTTNAIRDPIGAGTVQVSTRASRLRWYGDLIGWGSRRAIPRLLRGPLYRAYSRVTGADPGEAERELADYPTLGDFFARRLREGARPVDPDAAALISPCDGAVAAAGRIEGGTLIQAKGKSYRLDQLLADGRAAARLDGGWYATVYLSPADYHRVHAPIDGRVVAIDHVPGSLFPVKPVFTRNVEGLFARNERAVIHLETEIGPAAVVMVAAIGVAHLQLVHAPATARRERRRFELAAPAPVRRGDEVGAFLLGSTVVVVVPEAAGPIDLAVGEVVRVGQRIATIGRSRP